MLNDWEVLTKMLMLKLPIYWSMCVQMVLTREKNKKKKKVDKTIDKSGQMIYNIIIKKVKESTVGAFIQG